MLKIFETYYGPIYASTQVRDRDLTVDEVIDFLKPYRGMKFRNSATEDTSFCVKDGVVYCDQLDYWTGYFEGEVYGGIIEDWFKFGKKAYFDDRSSILLNSDNCNEEFDIIPF